MNVVSVCRRPKTVADVNGISQFGGSVQTAQGAGVYSLMTFPLRCLLAFPTLTLWFRVVAQSFDLSADVSGFVGIQGAILFYLHNAI